MTLRQILKIYIPDGIKGILRWMTGLGAPLLTFYYRHKHVGRGSFVDRTVHVLGWRSVQIGDNTSIGEGTCININNRSVPGLKVLVGNNCFVGRRNFFNNGQTIIISDYCMTSIDCRFNGADHIFSNPFLPYISTGVAADKTIYIGTNCWLGIGVTVLGHVSIGHGSIVGAGALVTKDLPPFSLAVGNPAQVIKRFDMISRAWIIVRDFTPEMDALLPDEATYLLQLRHNKPRISMAFAAAGKSKGDLP